MKKIRTLLALVLITTVSFAQVGIGTKTPHPTAILDIDVSSLPANGKKGFLPPRMTTAQRNGITSPAVGLVIYNTDDNCMQWHRGANIWHNSCGDNLYTQYPPGSNFCNVQPTAIVEVTNVHTGKIWMDRNLGASRAATSPSDAEAFGSLYQWGRRSDGHQCVNRFSGDGVTTSANTAVGATVDTDTPPHGDFIRISGGNNDWRSPINDLLWQGVNGVNNPCPSGFRVPTDVELNDERLSWVIAPISSTNDSNGAFASPLKLPLTGLRGHSGGTVSSLTNGNYWSSTVTTNFARELGFGPFSASTNPLGQFRGQGYAVRCIKN